MNTNVPFNVPLPKNTILNNYTIIKDIDAGGYSIVYYAKDNRTGKYVAIKEFLPQHLNLREQNSGTELFVKNHEEQRLYKVLYNFFLEEIAMVNKINHPNVIKCIDYFFTNNTAYLVMPYEIGEPLFVYMNNIYKIKQQMSEEEILHIAVGLLSAAQEMHRNKIIHLDLKPNNIWLRPNKDVVVLDFGTAMEYNAKRRMMLHTGGFSPIELYANTILDEKRMPKDRLNMFLEAKARINASNNNIVGYWTDYYAIGATIYNMLTLSLPPLSYELYVQGKQIDASHLSGFSHPKLIHTIKQLCQHEIEARKKIDLKDLINSLKNAIPYQHNKKTIGELISHKPEYVL